MCARGICSTELYIVVLVSLETFYPCIDLTITTEKLMELFAPLDPKKVDRLGGEDYLGLPQSEIARIQKDYQSPTQRKEAYLDLYVHQHPCPTWRQIAKVLRSWRVDLPQSADLVENTYVKGMQDHCSETIVSISIIVNTACDIHSVFYTIAGVTIKINFKYLSPCIWSRACYVSDLE